MANRHTATKGNLFRLSLQLEMWPLIVFLYCYMAVNCKATRTEVSPPSNLIKCFDKKVLPQTITYLHNTTYYCELLCQLPGFFPGFYVSAEEFPFCRTPHSPGNESEISWQKWIYSSTVLYLQHRTQKQLITQIVHRLCAIEILIAILPCSHCLSIFRSKEAI